MIELADLIQDLRTELSRATAQAQHEELRFELGPVEIEASVVVNRTAEADAKVRFWVVESGAKAGVGDARTHRITLTLQPRLADSASPPYISGDEVAGER